MITKDLGLVTAYAYAVSGGYTGTEAEFTELLGNIAKDLEEIEGLSVTVETLPPGSGATASYADGVLHLGIPRGDKGEKGDKGDKGDKGETGETGPQGPKGDPGDVSTEQLDEAISGVRTEMEESYARNDGYYEEMTVGDAEQLISTQFVEDSDPYLFRTTGGSADVGNREYLDKIVGGAVAWNQLCPISTKNSTTINGVTFTNNGDGSWTVSGTATAFTTYEVVGQGTKRPRVYALFGCPSGGSSSTYNLALRGAGSDIQDTGNGVVWDASATTSRYKGVSIVINANTVISTPITFRPQLFDLTALFNPTIADYIYSLEQAHAGDGVAWFRRYFPEDYYPYHAVSLESIQTSAHKTYDADGNVIGNYALDSSLTLRGVPKLADGKLAFDGDIYPPSGEVQRRYGLRAYQSGDESLADAITDGTNTVYKLATPTTETADGYEQYQRCDPSGTEEFVTDSIVPVGHETRYPANLRDKLQHLPGLPSPLMDGTYMVIVNGSQMRLEKFLIPDAPATDGTYTLKATVSGGNQTYTWEVEA